MSSLVNKPIVNRGQTFSDTQKSQARQNIGAASDFDLQNETAAREAADTQLQSNIDAEASRAQSAESALGTRIDGVEYDVEAIDTRLTTAESDIDSLESSVDALYNTEVQGTDGETSVSSSTSGKVKTFVVGLASAIKTKIEAAYSHISDAVKHITATERTNWNAAYTHSQTEGNPHGTEIEEIDGLRTELTTIESDVSAIEGVIPSEATTSNKLADKAFVNSSISSQTAYFRGTFDIVDDLGLTHGASNTAIANALASVVSVVTPNDYTFVIDQDTDGNTVYKRFKYSGSVWQYEYTLNNSSFTAAQWAAIQSGITAGDVADIGYNTAARHAHSNKNLLDTYTQSNASLADAVAKKHEHANKTILDNTTASYTSEEKAKLAGIESGAEVNVNADWDATSGDAKILNKPSTFPPSSHTHSIANVTELPTALNGKADKVSGATANHFAGLNSSGNLIDSGKKASDFATAEQGAKADMAYQKPSGGIPKTDLATSVQTSLGKADTALQQHQSLAGYVNGVTTDSTATFSDSSTILVGKNGKNVLTRTALALYNYIKGKLATVAASGSYSDLTNKPTIPAAANDATLAIKMNNATKGTFTANASTNKTIDLGTVITDVSDYAKADGSNASGDWAISATKGRIVSRTDFDALTTSGTYEILIENEEELSNSNHPPTEGTTASTCRGFIEVRNIGGTVGAIVQQATFNVGYIVTRRRQNNAWTSWKRMTYIPNGSAVGSPTQSVFVDAQGEVQACTGSNLAATSNQNITPTKAQLEANQYFLYMNNNASTYNLSIDADLLVDGKVYSITLVGDSSVTPIRTWNVRFKSSGGEAKTYSDYASYSVSTGTLTTSYRNIETSTTWRNKQVVRKGSSVYIFGY